MRRKVFTFSSRDSTNVLKRAHASFTISPNAFYIYRSQLVERITAEAEQEGGERGKKGEKRLPEKGGERTNH